MPRGKSQQPEVPPGPQPYLLDGSGAVGGTKIWSEVNPSVLAGAVACVTARGDALLLAYTQDGGAAAVTILAGTHKPRFYPASVEECERTLQQIADWATDNR
jgi:hypothetical protein